MDGMKCTPQELRKNLEEMYAWYFRKARAGLDIEVDKWTVEDAAEAGKATEGMDAIASIYLTTFGGRALFELWTRTMAECDQEESKICPSCGREYSGPVSYCTKCGARLRPADEPPEATTE